MKGLVHDHDTYMATFTAVEEQLRRTKYLRSGVNGIRRIFRGGGDQLNHVGTSVNKGYLEVEKGRKSRRLEIHARGAFWHIALCNVVQHVVIS